MAPVLTPHYRGRINFFYHPSVICAQILGPKEIKPQKLKKSMAGGAKLLQQVIS